MKRITTLMTLATLSLTSIGVISGCNCKGNLNTSEMEQTKLSSEKFSNFIANLKQENKTINKFTYNSHIVNNYGLTNQTTEDTNGKFGVFDNQNRMNVTFKQNNEIISMDYYDNNYYIHGNNRIDQYSSSNIPKQYQIGINSLDDDLIDVFNLKKTFDDYKNVAGELIILKESDETLDYYTFGYQKSDLKYSKKITCIFDRKNNELKQVISQYKSNSIIKEHTLTKDNSLTIDVSNDFYKHITLDDMTNDLNNTDVIKENIMTNYNIDNKEFLQLSDSNTKDISISGSLNDSKLNLNIKNNDSNCNIERYDNQVNYDNGKEIKTITLDDLKLENEFAYNIANEYYKNENAINILNKYTSDTNMSILDVTKHDYESVIGYNVTIKSIESIDENNKLEYIAEIEFIYKKGELFSIKIQQKNIDSSSKISHIISNEYVKAIK